MLHFTEGLSLFDRISLAHCAMRRAELNTFNDRFHDEYETARMWHRYNTYVYTYKTDNKSNTHHWKDN